MLQEVVRPGTLSRALTVQLFLGNAVEVLRLLQAGITVDSAEFEALRSAADSFRSNGGDDVGLTSSAVAGSSPEMVAAASAALGAATTQALQAGLRALADALTLIADTHDLNGVSISVEDMVRHLSAIREALAARAAVSTDETRTLLTA